MFSVMGDEKDTVRTMICNSLKISQSELLMMENRHCVVMRKVYSEINPSNFEDPTNDQIRIKIKETYEKFKRNEERERKRFEDSRNKNESNGGGAPKKVLNQTSGRVHKNHDLKRTMRKNLGKEKRKILDVITIGSDSDESSSAFPSSSNPSVLQSSLDGNSEEVNGKAEKEQNTREKGPSNGWISESDQSRQLVQRKLLDRTEGILDRPPDAVNTFVHSSLDISSHHRSTPSISQDSYGQLLTPPLSNAGMNQTDFQPVNQSTQPLQHSRRSLMDGTNNIFPQSTIQPSPGYYPNQFHPRSSLPNNLMYNSQQLREGIGPSKHSFHATASNENQSIPNPSYSFHPIDETPPSTSIFSCLKDLIHGVNSSEESDSWMEVIRPFRSDNQPPPPPPSQTNPSIPLTNPQHEPSQIPPSENNVMSNVNQYLPSSDYFNSSILE